MLHCVRFTDMEWKLCDDAWRLDEVHVVVK